MGKTKKETKGLFGYELILDLYQCEPESMRSSKNLREFVDKLCKILKMKKYGKTLTPYFGLNNVKTAGYSLLQFIETSSITGHFSEAYNSAYINIFSCKIFDDKKAAEFAVKFFGSKKYNKHFFVRK
ncbi:MAG: S-adenosylmethionine decarboxylase [Patescibacteria group bacterium]|nr:S-adenosylmethionine decarboxylase [Patescibacteria group bacterium]